MKFVKFILSLAVTLGLVFVLNSRLPKGKDNIPPLGKLLNPFTGFWQNAEAAGKFKDEEYNLPGLKDEVKVYFDDRLVPHVYAKNNDDLYYMQGYITAKYRLWQMEIQTHFAAGRVSEIVGERGLESDRLVRRIGMPYGAEAAEEFISNDPESKRLIKAYCDGVNAYISALKPKDYPIEYKLLDYKPEEWKPIKVGLLLKNMADKLSVFEYDIENANFVSKYGMDEFRQLYPDFNDVEDPIIPQGTPWNFEGNTVADEHGSFSGGTVPPIRDTTTSVMLNYGNTATVTALNANVIEKPDEITGSNNWAAGGSKTKSGKPILCNDPHLQLNLPSIWYEMHLVSPDMNVYGVTIPGSPAVIIGFNDSIAWGETNGGRDVRDWHQVKFKDASRNEYEYNGQWVKSEKKVEKYKVRGKGEVLDTVVYTKYGIVVFDESFGDAPGSRNLAMRWTAHSPSNEFRTFFEFNKGKNYDDYINALKHYSCPAQNFVFSSRSGDIAIKEQGLFPIRNKATEQGKYLSDGTTDKDEWKSYIPFENNPTVKNPARGFVSSANQHPTDTTYPYYYPGVGVYEEYRNRRINRLLTEGKDIDAQFMMKLQNDNYNLHASEALPVMLNLLDKSALGKEEHAIVEKLSAWNYYNNPNEVAPVYFEIWWNELRRLLWDEMQDKKAPMKQPSQYTVVTFLKTDSTSHFYDNLSTAVRETRADIIMLSFKRIKDTIAARQFTEAAEPYGADKTETKDDLDASGWARFKDTHIDHLARIAPFGVQHVMNGGNRGIVNATNSTHGPSWRMIVDEGAMKAYVVYPGGQSGNPGSAFYDNFIDTWAKGEYYEASFVKKPEELGSKKLFVSTYKPQ